MCPRRSRRERFTSPTITCCSICFKAWEPEPRSSSGRSARFGEPTINTRTADIQATITDTAMDDASPLQATETGQGILPLFAWLSPSYPVGCYAYSHTLEWAVEAGDVTNEETLIAWLTDQMTLGFGRNDAILLSHAYRAVEVGDGVALAT